MILINEDFASGLSGWDIAGAVFEGIGEAAITDENAVRSFLYQGIQLDPGSYEININLKPLLASEEPLGFARDTFFASLYLSTTPELFDPRTPEGFDAFLELFDFDAAGPFDFSGEFMSNPGKPDYVTYSQGFTLESTSTLFAVFELSDLNGINDNSIVLVDSVVILIPEPASALFAGLAALLALLFYRRRP
jgi:hypothetical protein